MAGRRGNTRQSRGWRVGVANLVRSLADRLHPSQPPRVEPDPRLGRLLLLPGLERLDRRAWERGEVRIEYRATDPLWGVDPAAEGLVSLREHVRRLCIAAHELSRMPLDGRWGDVAHNLELAHSLNDVFADTDIDDTSLWCSPAADYEAADSEVAAKHLSCVIVFTLVWTAYECAVDMLVSGGGGKGARGRDLIASREPSHVPHLRETLLAAMELDPRGTDHSNGGMRAMMKAGSVAGVAAEHLRQFRNRSIHGDLPKPDPTDWGPRAEYVADADPRLRRFQANTRLTLLLLQILAASDVKPGTELEEGLDDPYDAKQVLLSLHCSEETLPSCEDEEDQMDFGCPYRPAIKRMWR